MKQGRREFQAGNFQKAAELAGANATPVEQASAPLQRIEHTDDAFGMVDAVLNYVETNHVGAMPFHGDRPRRRLPDLLASLF